MFQSCCISKSTVPSSSAMILTRRAARLWRSACFSSAANDNNDKISGRDSQSKTQGRVGEQHTPAPSGRALTHQQQPQTRKRTRRRILQSSLGEDDSSPIPSLADFMYRAKVLNQYRNFIRLAQFVDGNDKRNNETALGEVRLSYRMSMQKGMDELAKNMAFSEGERRLRETGAMVGYSPNKKSRDLDPQSFDEDSWINIKDEEDPRGRVGVQWPWEKGSN